MCSDRRRPHIDTGTRGRTRAEDGISQPKVTEQNVGQSITRLLARQVCDQDCLDAWVVDPFFKDSWADRMKHNHSIASSAIGSKSAAVGCDILNKLVAALLRVQIIPVASDILPAEVTFARI